MGGGILDVWETAEDNSLTQLIGANIVVIRQQLARSVTEPTEGAGKVGTIGEYFWEGGSG